MEIKGEDANDSSDLVRGDLVIPMPVSTPHKCAHI